WRELYGAVFPFVSGSKPMGSPSDLAALGEALGLLHMYSINEKLAERGFRCHSEVGYDLSGVLAYCEDPNALAEFKDACSKMLDPQEISLWKESDLPMGLIHGDLYIDNALFENGKLQMLLDFEQSGIGCFIQDIGISISGSCLDKDGVNLDMIQAFLEGYQKQRQLSVEESKLLNFAITLGLLEISLWRIKRFYDGDLDPQKRDSYKELIELAVNFNSKL
ncbi:MAG: phosphotransferase, partial [Bacteriovoracaceae bacterium]|nr:phosphotransferase [Bacteriovoracaceae bacterium]